MRRTCDARTPGRLKPFPVWTVSVVIDFLSSVDLVAAGGFIAPCLCLDGSSSVFSAHEMQLLSSTGGVSIAL